MSKKITSGLIGSLILFCFISFVYAMGEKPSTGIKNQPNQEQKIYVSKAGFSVSYPKDWYLYEEKGAGWRVGPEGPAFGIYNVDPDDPLSVKSIPEDKRIGMFFKTFSDLDGSPKNIERKLNYFADEFGMRSIEERQEYNKNGVDYLLVYGIPRGYSYELCVVFFFLPESKSIANILIKKHDINEVRQILDEKITIKVE